MLISENYDYTLPKELIASAPSKPRDRARLFVYDTESDKISFTRFAEISNFLPAQSLLVLNETKVVPARVKLQKESGGFVEILFLVNERIEEGIVPCVADRKLVVGKFLSFPNGMTVTVKKQEGPKFFLKPDFPFEELQNLLRNYGTTPIPKYIKNTSLSEEELRERYQTVFAKYPASAAAPTASLHFTQRVFESLSQHEIEYAPVTLHVGLGTFAPVRKENISERRLHSEWFEIPEKTSKTIRFAKQEGRRVVAVGTTVVRTLESSAEKILEEAGRDIRNNTDLFIFPPFEFKVTDALITNFHVPRSSLMMLVDAFLEHKNARKRIVELYEIAIKERFRFFSFGDAMLIV